jgi:hypothetical protein
MLSRTNPAPGRLCLSVLLLCLALSSAAALDIAKPDSLPLMPTADEWAQILREARRVGDATPLDAGDCQGAGFHSLAERNAEQAAGGGDILLAYTRLCQRAILEDWLKTQRLNRSRCCGG